MSSHASAPVTTSLLTILCVALVHRDRPDWLAVSVGQAARAAALSPERVSRLASRIAGRRFDRLGYPRALSHVDRSHWTGRGGYGCGSSRGRPRPWGTSKRRTNMEERIIGSGGAVYSPPRVRLASRGDKVVSPTLVFRIAKFASVGVDDVLTGKFR